MASSQFHFFKCNDCKWETWSFFIPQCERMAEAHMMETGHTVVESEARA